MNLKTCFWVKETNMQRLNWGFPWREETLHMVPSTVLISSPVSSVSHWYINPSTTLNLWVTATSQTSSSSWDHSSKLFGWTVDGDPFISIHPFLLTHHPHRHVLGAFNLWFVMIFQIDKMQKMAVNSCIKITWWIVLYKLVLLIFFSFFKNLPKPPVT